MSHHIYTTPGFVIDSKPNGEAGRLLFIFTRDLGLVAAQAQGVRLGVSKLRYHTQDFSFSLFSLVRGREIWRLTGATLIADEPTRVDSPPSYFIYVRVLAVLRRLLHGEEKNEALFDALLAFVRFLVAMPLIDEETSLAECIIVLRILHLLGYVSVAGEAGAPSVLLPFIQDPTQWNEALLEQMKTTKTAAVTAINLGLKASQL